MPWSPRWKNEEMNAKIKHYLKQLLEKDGYTNKNSIWSPFDVSGIFSRVGTDQIL